MASRPTVATVGERIVVVTARRVSRDGHDLGAVLIVRDRTDVESLTRQLDAVQAMSTVLRAQRHEFANRLHLLNGLIQAGRLEEASHLLDELLGSGPLGAALPGIDAIHDPYLQAFLAAKGASAREAGVTLLIGPNTWVSGSLALPVDVTTVLGNLLDNALEAARTTAGDTREVEVELVQEGSTLHITVADSGDGVAPDFVEHLFTEGASTRPDRGIPGGRGVGLALSRQIARALGGELRLSTPANATASLRGAEFIARLPGVMLEEQQRMGNAELNVLVVDDDFRVANLHAGIVDAIPGFTVTATASTLADARKAAAAAAIDLALVDVYLPDGSGIDFVRELHCDTMVLTAATEADTIRAALAAGALSYLVKPFTHAALATRLAGYARYRRILAGPNLGQEHVDAALESLRPRTATPQASVQPPRQLKPLYCRHFRRQPRRCPRVRYPPPSESRGQLHNGIWQRWPAPVR